MDPTTSHTMEVPGACLHYSGGAITGLDPRRAGRCGFLPGRRATSRLTDLEEGSRSGEWRAVPP